MNRDARDFAQWRAAIERRLRRVERADSLGNSAVTGGLTITDDDGAVLAVVGSQPDGTTSVTYTPGPAPPAPAAPVVVPWPGGLVVQWDGTYVGGEVRPSDLDHLTIHAAPTDTFGYDSSTMVGALPVGGGSTFVPLPEDPQYVRLVARTLSGAATASAAVLGDPLRGSGDSVPVDVLADPGAVGGDQVLYDPATGKFVAGSLLLPAAPHAFRPDPTTVLPNSLFPCLDHLGTIYWVRNGVWETWLAPGGGGTGGGGWGVAISQTEPANPLDYPIWVKLP